MAARTHPSVTHAPYVSSDVSRRINGRIASETRTLMSDEVTPLRRDRKTVNREVPVCFVTTSLAQTPLGGRRHSLGCIRNIGYG